MISNNTAYKLKTSKSREFNDYEHGHSGDNNYENESGESDVVESCGRYHGSSRESPYRGSSRSRATEFRSSRIHDRGDRRGFRGRGNLYGRRGDRDYSDVHVLSRKYDSGRSDSGYHGKYHDSEKKNEVKLNLPEDTRISKLLRRLSIEVDQDNSLIISKKLLEVLLLPDNALYVRKAFHILGESMYDILQVSPGRLAKHQAARALGRMGYIMGQENDFERYQNWFFNKINNSTDELIILFMKSMKETLAFEKTKPVLKDHIKKFIHNLVLVIETTENAEVFKSILDVVITTVELYPDAFHSQFQDTIDLVFGWHVDNNQPLSNIKFISKNLQRIRKHFQHNLELSVTLTENFLDDITTYTVQMNDGNDPSTIDHITVLILALNTILKCLDVTFHPANNKFVTVEYVNNCLSQIIKTAADALVTYIPDNLIIAANESIGILLTYLENKSVALSTSIYNLMDIELTLLTRFSDATIISLLLLISKVIKELSANLPADLIQKLIGPASPIIEFRYSPYKIIRESVISVYQALLNLKNVSLLQEAYRYVLGDLDIVYRQLVPEISQFVQNNPFENVPLNLDNEQMELTVLFLLRCLSQLANASSIIVMWALKPSILELVGVDMQPYNVILAKNTPTLQYSLLYLLYSHCKCYNHFISNSSLVSKKLDQASLIGRFALSEGLNINDVPNTSPNSGNFAIILDILYKTLNVETSIEVHLLLLQWLNDILVNSECYLENLYDKDRFVPVTQVLVKCGYNSNSKVILAVYENLTKLLSNKQLSWHSGFLINICDLCKLHMNSIDPKIRECYSKLSSHIPWDIAIVEFNKPNCNHTRQKNVNMKNYNNYMISYAQRLHLNGVVYGEMYPFLFKRFMGYLLKNENIGDHWLEDMFTLCWDYDEEHSNSELIYELAINSRTILHSWVALEAAEFCVNLKLRTPLGKPNETFTKIESSLNQLGNELISLKKIDPHHRIECSRVRLLIQFIEQLEKSIYNASEGCAIAMMQPQKTVRSFFIANANTCNEWLSRIRMVMMHVALHVGDFSVVVRHGHALLKDLVNSGKASLVEFERASMFVTLALLNLRETEALYGLYIWCKATAGRRFSWIKCAAEQSSRRYEIAIQGYKTVLSAKLDTAKHCSDKTSEESDKSDNNKKLDSDIQCFILDQILMCYKELNDYVNLADFYTSEVLPVKATENGRRYWFSTIDWECLINLFNIEDDAYSFNELSQWDYKGEAKSWSTYDASSTVENNLFNLALNMATDREHCTKKVEFNQSLIQKNIQDLLDSAPSEFLQNFCLMNYICNGLKHISENTPANTVFLVSENFENEVNKIDSSILRQILWWSEYFGQVQNQPFTTFSSNLKLDVMKRARKEKNFQLAVDYFHKFLRGKDLLFDLTDNQSNELWYVGSYFVQEVTRKDVWSVDVARAITEIIKLSYAKEEQKKYYTFNLCAAASTEISKNTDKVYGGLELRKISSKILLKLASWLQTNEQISLTELNSPIGKLLMVLPEIGMMENTVASVIPSYEMAVGKLLQFSVHQCPGLGKGWNAFGTWCYRWGRKVIDSSVDIKNNLTEEDYLAIKTLLPPDITQEDLTKILMILSQTRSSIDEEDIDSNEINTSEMIQNQLQCVGALRNATELQLQGLVQIWRNTQKRIYSYYALSAEAYFKYLQLVTNSENVTKSTEFDTITVTLRLLRLMVKYALELQCILEEGLETTPTQPWKVIIPQLFSRLNHPESYVRHRVSDLLCRVAEDAPHLITFPAVVGALDGGLKFDFSEISLPKDCLSQNNEDNDYNELHEEVDNFESDSEDCTSALQTCFKTMVDTLSKQDPEMIAQVQTFVRELRRITLLWDELWLGTLAQHHSEISKRQQQLEYEIEKVNENISLNKEEKVSLIAEKHRIIIKPIIFILEQLYNVTSVEPETPHERVFQERYLEEVTDVIKKLKNPENPEKPVLSLQPLKALQKKFQQKFHKRGSYTLKMQDISPVLANMRNTVIVMPGLASSIKARVTISHASNIVSILPTKTKPKKLVFYGSDGQTYTYLFKGLEDLHLDERIMQFLSIANTMMAHNTDSEGHNLYRAKHYSVIPLGPRSGLISWVDGTTPVFTVYKRWQQRESVKPSKNNTSSNTTVLRPSELFYNKLNPLLQEHGVKNIENRKEWPLSVLKQVLSELMAETPSDLLAKELWCNAVSAASWWQVVKRYSYSVAVMSIIGYIIGLGDRHLDNVLVDLNSGEVIHIDYNVCFEKGKTLRVPEKVPFRLTPNIRDALGITGVEGIFRLACENVLKIMRKGRETLLTLLEAFVYDPLIDWTTGGEVLAGTTFGTISTKTSTRQSRKDLEKEVTLAMFNVRCTEMKAEWNENKDEILAELPILMESLNSWMEMNKQIVETEDYLQDLHQQMALIKEAEAHGANKHPLYSLPSRYDSYHKTQDALSTARRDLDKILAAAEKHISTYNIALNTLESHQLNQWLIDLNKTVDTDSMNVFDLVKEFLHNAGKNDVIAQCEHSEIEVAKLAQVQNNSTRKCLMLLQEYQSILTQCPKSYTDNHRMYLFLKWAKYLLESKNLESCDMVYEKFRLFLDVGNCQQILKFSYSLDALYKETISHVNKLFEDLNKRRNHDSNAVLEKVYANARIGISTFLNCEKGATSAFEFVIASELIILNQGILTLETTAHRSGEYLIKLTTRDGDWFLDDLVLNSTRAVELINNLPLPQNGDDMRLYQVLNGIRIANNVYRGLQELHFNFHTIILPESMKKIQSEEFSIIHMMTELKKVVLSIGVSIPDIIIQLEKILPCLLLQMDLNPSYQVVLETIANVRKKFQALVQNQSETLSPGKMLLMGFNGLFEKLNQEMNSLVTTLGTLDIPPQWKKLDQVKEAKSIAAHIFNPEVRKILEDIFMLKRLQAMSDFFTLCQEMCQSFKGVGSATVVLNDEQLTKPVKQFIADFISRQVLGITTEAIAYSICFLLQRLGLDVTKEIEQQDIGAESKVAVDELYQKAWNYLIKQGIFTSNILSQASSLETNLKSAWEKIQEPKNVEQKLAILQSSVLRMQNQLTVHNFMYEEILTQFNIYTPVRSKFILELKTEMTNLKGVFDKLKEAREKQKTLIDSAYQRLNWAKGANPNVVEISAAFVGAVEKRNSQMNMEQNISTELLNICGSVLQHEVLRTHCTDSKTYDKLFLSSFEKWRIACQYNNVKCDALTSTEESIMNLLTPELLTDPQWLQTISDNISELISLNQKKLSDKKSELFLVDHSILSKVENLKNIYGVHARLMSDVKNLLKTMTKIDEYSQITQEFKVIYHEFIEKFTVLFNRFKKDIAKEDVEKTIKGMKLFEEETKIVYDGLLNLEDKKRDSLLVINDEFLRASPMLRNSIQQQMNNSNNKGQQRNAYAVSVWRRVKMKLEGRDPDSGRKCTPQEQVDYIIREATSLDNLALLYEGWTPWV